MWSGPGSSRSSWAFTRSTRSSSDPRRGSSTVSTSRLASPPAAAVRAAVAPRSLTGTLRPRRCQIQAATAVAPPIGRRPADRSARSDGTIRTGSLIEPSAAIWTELVTDPGIGEPVGQQRPGSRPARPAGNVRCRQASSQNASTQVAAHGVGDGLVDGGVATHAAGVGEEGVRRRSAGQSLRCSYGVTSSTILAPAVSHAGPAGGEASGRSPIRCTARSAPASCHGSAALGGHQGAVVVGGGGGDPVHHRGGEVDLGRRSSPAGQGRAARRGR